MIVGATGAEDAELRFQIDNFSITADAICEFDHVEIIPPSRPSPNPDSDFDVQNGDYILRRPDYIQAITNAQSETTVIYKLTDSDRTFQAFAKSKEGYVLVHVDSYRWDWQWTDPPETPEDLLVTNVIDGSPSTSATILLGTPKTTVPSANFVVNSPAYTGTLPVSNLQTLATFQRLQAYSYAPLF